VAWSKGSVHANFRKEDAVEHGAKGAAIREVKSDDSIKSAMEAHGADLYVKTGRTGGRRFLVSVEGVQDKTTLIALHL